MTVTEIIEEVNDPHIAIINYDIKIGNGLLYELIKSLEDLKLKHIVIDVSSLRDLDKIKSSITDNSIVVIDGYDKIHITIKYEFDYYLENITNKVILVSHIHPYKEILLQNGYQCFGNWFKKETDKNIHYAWIWRSNNNMKMVGYLKEEGKEYGEKQYFVSPYDEMNNEILQNFITNNVF